MNNMKFSIGDVSIAEDDVDKLIVITNLRDTSIRSNAGTALTMWIRRMWREEYKEMITRLATKHRLSTDEVFWRARRDISLDEVAGDPRVMELREWMRERNLEVNEE